MNIKSIIYLFIIIFYNLNLLKLFFNYYDFQQSLKINLIYFTKIKIKKYSQLNKSKLDMVMKKLQIIN